MSDQKPYNIKSIGFSGGLDLVFARGWTNEEKITVNGAELELSNEFHLTLAGVLGALPKCLDLPQKFAHRVEKINGEIKEVSAKDRSFYAEKIVFGHDDGGEFVQIMLGVGIHGFPEASQVKLPKAYLRPGSERQISMFPADLENHLIELKRQCNVVVEDYIKTFEKDIQAWELRDLDRGAQEVIDAMDRKKGTKLEHISGGRKVGEVQL
ncbi:hypothetical protein [Prosthecochloris sp.]|uniref:hypothetical protein n=1 Tax=Prosthecochloris sp. TaxID=290513 RepID=UPI0025CC6393|nr:hypothetical protein [Prosthecochloris sp.]